MMIEIRKAGFFNKGAELMLFSAVKKLREEIPNCKIAMTPTYSAPFYNRAQLGLFQGVNLMRYGLNFSYLFNLIPRKIRSDFGLVVPSELDLVLDVAGFAYGDQWGLRNVWELASLARRLRRGKTKIILLPQAFGPFQNKIVKRLMKAAVDDIALIFARDSISYQHLTEAVGQRQNIRIAPDFTNLMPGEIPHDFDKIRCEIAIVPNSKMLRMTGNETRQAYLPFLVRCIEMVIKKGRKPFILLHETNADLALAEKLSQIFGNKLPVIQEEDPLKIKGILGQSLGTIGGRFHGLVSALSQGCPALGTSWSHKYKMLFEDYGCPGNLLTLLETDDDLSLKIDSLTNEAKRKELVAIIQREGDRLKAASEDMWADVFNVFINHPPR